MRQKVFLLHAKIAKWHHCNADKLKTLKAKYMLIRLLYAYRMTEYVGKISLRNSKRLLRKLQKNLRGYFFCLTLWILNIMFNFIACVTSSLKRNFDHKV